MSWLSYGWLVCWPYVVVCVLRERTTYILLIRWFKEPAFVVSLYDPRLSLLYLSCTSCIHDKMPGSSLASITCDTSVAPVKVSGLRLPHVDSISVPIINIQSNFLVTFIILLMV
jgi:hypothetical protein